MKVEQLECGRPPVAQCVCVSITTKKSTETGQTGSVKLWTSQSASKRLLKGFDVNKYRSL